MRQMTATARSIALTAVALCVLGGTASATTTLVCKKTGKTISDVIAALKPANGYNEIDVSGSCSDNVYIPPNQAIHLVAASGTTLSPANTGSPTLVVEGRIEIDNLAMSTGSANGITIAKGGYAALLGGSITGGAIGVQVNDNATVLIQDTSISTSGAIAINNSLGSVEIDGVAKLFGATGTTITNGGNPGLYCAQGNVLLTTSGGGPITFNGGGIDLSGCNFKAYGSATQPITTENTGPSTAFLPGISISGGYTNLNYVQVINNNNIGIFANEGADVEISASTISGNTGAAFSTAQNAVLHFVPYSGVNTITEPNVTQSLFDCYQGSKIYVDQIANTITPAPTQAQLGCLTIGGP